MPVYELISDGLPLSFDRTQPSNELTNFFSNVISALVEELMRKLSREASPPVTCLIADNFFIWPSTIAKKFSIPYVSFCTQPALVFSLGYHMDLLIKNGHFASSENRKDAITYIPGLPAIEPTDLFAPLQEADISSTRMQLIIKALEDSKRADFVLCNSVQELESKNMLALQQEEPFYAIGPLNIPSSLTRGTVTTTLRAESVCSQWLDTKPAGSVLYISFGSFSHVSKRDLEEIAYGVLDSKTNFMRVVRQDIVCCDETEPLPRGFIEESRGTGITFPWCRQMEVLSHPSVGGFLTQCGWNSVLESVWCGVPMMCFPVFSDQVTNRKFVVKDWKIGIDLGRIDRKEVSRRVDSLMGGKVGNEAKKMVKEMSRKLQSAVTADGSSQKNFDQFVEDLTEYDSQKRRMK